VRTRIVGPSPDRYVAPELAVTEELIGDGAVLRAVETAIGPLE
jgi:histidine ammonia-lyase